LGHIKFFFGAELSPILFSTKSPTRNETV